MDKRDIDFKKRIRVTFRIEAEEHISAISANLAELKNALKRLKSFFVKYIASRAPPVPLTKRRSKMFAIHWKVSSPL
jgi:hypothetical protein